MVHLQELEKNEAGYYATGAQLKDHIYARARVCFAAGDAARDALCSAEDIARRQQELRRFFRGQCLGGLPAMDTPLNPRITGTVAGAGFKIEKLIFESRPKHYVTCNLYLPGGITKPSAAVLFVCGHWDSGKQWPEYQTVCQILAQSGLIVLAQDPIGQGERWSYWDAQTRRRVIAGCCPEHDYAGAQCHLIGDSLARYFVHDSMRALDYLISRPEVDALRLGITGNSGGGTQSSLMMMCDPRLAAAAPTTFIMSRETYMLCGGAQDSEQVWPGFSTAGFDHEDILLGMWPKPVQVMATTYDFFPIEGPRRTVQRCKRLWEIAGKADDLRLVEDQWVHNFTVPLAVAAAKFFNEKLNGREVTPRPERVKVFVESELYCTESGQVRGELPDAAFAFEANRDRLAHLAAARPSREEARKWLRHRVTSNRKPSPTNLRVSMTDQCRDLDVENGIWWSQEELLGHGILLRHDALRGKTLPVTIAIWQDGCRALGARETWIRQTCHAGRAVLVLDVSGEGTLKPDPIGGAPERTFYDTLHYLADHLIFMGDDLASLRTYDVTRAIDVLGEWPGVTPDGVHLFGDGRQGVYATLAGAIDDRVKHVEVRNSIESLASLVRDRYYDAYDIKSLIVHGLLRYADLKDLGND